MATKREKLRAGIALIEMAAHMLNQAVNEFGGESSEYVRSILTSCAADVLKASQRAAVEYDRAKP